jgi:hypothetical protein|uniref:C2H2-type domain-containing protein n=1 Tax=viral metagenome TaxID=1070528 RepID=A0A6C0ISW1_9ZZZZ
MPKNAEIFNCENCNFICSKKSNYNKHLLTAKHQKLTFVNKKMPKNAEPLVCEFCKKHYKSRVGLWKHKQRCSDNNNTVLINDVTTTKTSPDMNVFVDLLKQNQEFKELLTEQQQEIHGLHRQLIDAVKHTGNNIQNQTINHNQNFNLNFFLNEQCKDAINMSEFLENMELDIEDLTETGRLGYVGGISRILINKLREMDTYKRPLHCTDMKRETLYIRENDEWLKENNSKEKLKEIVDKVSNKNCKNIKKWTDEHSEYNVFDSPQNQEYLKVSNAALGGFGEQETKQFRDKIIRNVIKEVMVNKYV